MLECFQGYQEAETCFRNNWLQRDLKWFEKPKNVSERLQLSSLYDVSKYHPIQKLLINVEIWTSIRINWDTRILK